MITHHAVDDRPDRHAGLGLPSPPYSSSSDPHTLRELSLDDDRPVLTCRVRREKFGSIVYRLSPGLCLLVLNHTASEILSRCDGNASLRTIAADIAGQYSPNFRERIQQDVLAFVQTSIGQGVLSCGQV